MCWTVFILTLFLCSYVCHGYYYEHYHVPDNGYSRIEDYNDENALAAFKNVQKKSYRKRLICRRWNHHCVPWTHKAAFQCCSDLSCKCNLWMQNCRCVSKLWGK